MRAMNVVVGLLGLALAAPSLAQVIDSCGGGCPKPPSNSRAVSAEAIPLAAYPGNTLSATLAKGKKKTLLRVDGMITDANGGSATDVVSREFWLAVSVNGLAMHPGVTLGPASPEAIEDCGSIRPDPDRKCTDVGHWWLDMDDPANSPLIGVPITVTLVGGDAVGGAAVGSPVDVSLDVRLDKK
jgi:hypothetical protein